MPRYVRYVYIHLSYRHACRDELVFHTVEQAHGPSTLSAYSSAAIPRDDIIYLWCREADYEAWTTNRSLTEIPCWSLLSLRQIRDEQSVYKTMK